MGLLGPIRHILDNLSLTDLQQLLIAFPCEPLSDYIVDRRVLALHLYENPKWWKPLEGGDAAGSTLDLSKNRTSS